MHERAHSAQPILEIHLTGPPHARGVQHGEAAADRIRNALDFYGTAFAERGLDGPRRAALATELAAVIDGFAPDLLRELEGIARGAGVALADVVALNARSEMLRMSDDGCTAVAVLPAATADGHTLLGQNWDWHPSRRAGGVLLRIQPDDGPAILTFTEAGTLGRCGLNEHGLGVVGNALECAGGGASGAGGVPVAAIRRALLGCADVTHARALARETPRGTSVNHLVADAGGHAVSLEATVPAVYDVAPTDGLLEHSNHFRAAAARGHVIDTGIARTPDTLLRDRRLRALLDAERPVTPDTLRRAFADHDGYPESICRHAETVDLRTWVTVASVVMDLDARALWLAPGPVCENDYTRYALAP